MSNIKPKPDIGKRSEISDDVVQILMNELTRGKTSGEENGWLTSEDVRKHFKSKFKYK
ncbi:hypothetical protein [Ohessyouella blattaphilus]|uniref:Uncharacterized protein n=1 Tax=Ohessyouella blattaphilus TaxID=2949333 RepID=A0ABT1EL63_9FIRM|nr:hypothetical protein [Ohessyouella blattaphilus]MCP1111261.1 hypothetical protein [Ohessyouella blattaphilus]MCR8564655.1 hypothetical protein [Ohessyouella blattaphilus]